MTAARQYPKYEKDGVVYVVVRKAADGKTIDLRWQEKGNRISKRFPLPLDPSFREIQP